ncbi:MAG: hypothetical protein IT289_04870 [Oligoflexia bacterium]|nr:hypothetical protein [Oligoflexia bacterium]
MVFAENINGVVTHLGSKIPVEIQKADMDTLLREIRDLFLKEKNQEQTKSTMLELLGKKFICDWVVYWQVNEKARALRFEGVWMTPSFKADELESDVRKRIITQGDGMPGRVWRLGQPMKSLDIIRDMMLPRSLDASSSGIKEGIWFPVFKNETVSGIIEMLRSKSAPNGPHLLVFLEDLGRELGEYF